MDCAQARKIFKKYLQHSTDADKTQAVEEHLSRCESCRLALESAMGDSETMRNAKKFLIPALLVIAIAAVPATMFFLKRSDTQTEPENAQQAVVMPQVLKEPGSALPQTPRQRPEPVSEKSPIEQALKGDWVALFYPRTVSPASIPQDLGMKPDFPQEEGTISIGNKEYRFVRIAVILNAPAIQEAIQRLQKQHEVQTAERLTRYLQGNPAPTETSIVYFYALYPAAS